MVFNRILIWQVAIIFTMVCNSIALAQGGPNAEDLLNPSLDQPIAQYESTGVAPFESIENNVPKPTSIATPPPVSPLTVDPGALRSNTDQGVELVPNPLANPGSWTPPSTSVIETSPNPVVPKTDPGKLTSVEPSLGGLPFKPQSNVNRSVPSSLKKRANDFRLDPSPPSTAAPASKKSTTRKSPKVGTKNLVAKKKKSVPAPRQPVVNYDVYRDRSAWPIDPRKPINPCTQAKCQCSICASAKPKPGLHGRPYQPQEPGGCDCGKRCPSKHPQFSAYWPRPFSAKLDERNPERAAARYAGCQKPKPNDVFDRFANFRLIDYQRTDNGYCGRESDPYGCLGESKVSGVGYRVQSEPVAPAGAYPLR